MPEPTTSTAAAIALIIKIVPATVGALVSLRFLKIEGTFNKIATTLGGIAASYYAADPVAHWLGAPEGLIGFGLGLFGMAVIAKGFEIVAAINAQGFADWLQSWLPTRGGK
jgi:hypothetical protein